MMSQFTYGVLSGIVSGHLRDADDDHYQILVNADETIYRIAVNVHSSLKPPDLLFQSMSLLPDELAKQLQELSPGFKKLANKPGGLAQDFVRGGLVNVSQFKVVPGDVPGADNDLKDTLESAVLAAIAAPGAVVYAFGSEWGPETKKDQYFKFVPGKGVHDIHMNQGNDKGHASEDGVYRDGCLIFSYPEGKWKAFFMAFQSQTFDTNDTTGHLKDGGAPANAPAGKAKKKTKSRTKSKTKKRRELR
jgi:uncharacterized protein YukJ